MSVKFQMAGTFDETKHGWMWDSPVIAAEIKLDGMRVKVISRDTGRNEILTRNDKDYSDKIRWLSLAYFPKDTIIDGELVVVEGSSNSVSNFVAEKPEKLEFVMFDVLQHEGINLMDKEYVYRREVLGWIFDEVKKLNKHSVASRNISLSTVSLDKKREFCEKVIGLGGEGIIFKALNSKYKFSNRTNWLKVKAVQTVDVIITDAESPCTRWTCKPNHVHTDGKTYPEGIPSTSFQQGFVGLSYGYWVDHKIVRFGSLGVTGKPEDMIRHVGKVAEIKTYGMYENGCLRHPVLVQFRDDKHIDECTLDLALDAVGRKHLIKAVDNGKTKDDQGD